MKKTNFTKDTFQDTWVLILQKTNPKRKHNDTFNIIQEKHYFQETPLLQEYLTDKMKITDKKIEYSYFVQLSSDQINTNNLYDCFHGILFFIYFYSENKLNIEEVEFYYSGGRERKNYLTTITQNPILYGVNQSDILNIFDYSNFNTYFRIDTIPNAFFGVKFKRIKVNPTSYSIRSGGSTNNIPHLVSFIFEGYDEDTGKWDVLDERVNINDLIKVGGYKMFYVRKTIKYYSAFQIRQIEPGHNNFWGFSLSAFDIHGIVILRNDVSMAKDTELLESPSNSFDLFDDYNPIIDMSSFL